MKRVVSLIILVALSACVFCTGCKRKSKEAELYMLGFDDGTLYNSFVIKTVNDKIIVIDGGAAGNGHENAPYMPAAIRAILGLKQDEYFEIEAWFLSHVHDDHFYELAKCTMQYEFFKPECNYKINNIYFDFPDYEEEWKTQISKNDYSSDASLRVLKSGLLNYYKQNELVPKGEYSKNAVYDMLNGAVINSDKVKEGLTIEIDGVKFEILKAFNKTDKVVNSTSVVMRMETESHSVLFLGDSWTDTGDWLLKNYPTDRLKAEYIQMAHHGQSGTNQHFYDEIDAKNSKRLWPTPKWVWEVYNASNGLQTDKTRTWLDLPADYTEFQKSDKDIVVGLYEHYPDDITSVKSWKKVIKEQRVF